MNPLYLHSVGEMVEIMKRTLVQVKEDCTAEEFKELVILAKQTKREAQSHQQVSQQYTQEDNRRGTASLHNFTSNNGSPSQHQRQ